MQQILEERTNTCSLIRTPYSDIVARNNIKEETQWTENTMGSKEKKKDRKRRAESLDEDVAMLLKLPERKFETNSS